MINSLNLVQNTTSFSSKKTKKEDKLKDETRILPNTMKTRLEQSTQKTMSAFIDYPIKGLKGDINSNFYEFLTMGIVPYLAGSAMFMIVFNALNLGKHLGAKDAKASAKIGQKMALGVVLYGILKNVSKHFVTKPIEMATGVDTEMPYQNKVYNLPKGAGENAQIEAQFQQRKIFDSKEFFRKDLLDRSYYDKVAKKLGMGENLNDSISETTPIIQNIVATSNAAKSLSSYAWAAVGVGLAVQDAWLDLFSAVSNRKHYASAKDEGFFSKLGGKLKVFGENSWNITKQFGKSAVKSCKQLWCGNPNSRGFMKHSGKALIGTAAGLTLGLTANTILRAKNMAKNTNINTIDKSKESTVI
ncbi:hypothetical protein IJ384_01265 [bacterium]|nr:hypothetical protein [bacterium]